MLNNYICALDLGSSKISAVVADIKKKHIYGLFFETAPSKGIKRGVIIDSIALIGSVGEVLKNLKAKSGINIKFIYTNISGSDITTKHTRAIIPLAERGSKVITLSDMDKVNEQARILGSNLEEEIIHQIPSSYTIDSQSNISNPVGLYSHSLEVDLLLVCVRLSTLQGLTRSINQSGYEVRKVFLSGLATSKIVFNKRSQEGINLLCDIGSDITELFIFKDGILRDIEVLPFGGDDLSISLSDALKIPFDLAEDVRRSYGFIGDVSKTDENKEILIKKSNIYKPIKQKIVLEIITSKAQSICQAMKDAVEKKVNCTKIDNFVVSGRAILLEGFIEMLENTLGIPVRLGRIVDPGIISFANSNSCLSGQKYLDYITALGIICEVLKGRQPQITSFNQPTHNPFLKALNRAKEVYQEYF